MQELYHKLSHFSLEDAIKIEESDRQFIALQKLINSSNSKAEILTLELSKIMKQKITDKTIVFAVKMFSYIARNIFDFEYFPKNIMIPIDSRLEKIFERYKGDYTDISLFYFDLSQKLDIALLHLDAILWVNYEEIIS